MAEARPPGRKRSAKGAAKEEKRRGAAANAQKPIAPTAAVEPTPGAPLAAPMEPAGSAAAPVELQSQEQGGQQTADRIAPEAAANAPQPPKPNEVTMAEAEFGVIDWKSPTPLSNWLGWKVLSDNPTPASTWLGQPVLQTKPTPNNTLASIRKMSSDPAPLSRMFGWSLLKSDDSTPASKKFNWTVLCDGATPLSDKFGWSVLKTDEPTPLSTKLGWKTLI